jgi:hypothetical protein
VNRLHANLGRGRRARRGGRLIAPAANAASGQQHRGGGRGENSSD